MTPEDETSEVELVVRLVAQVVRTGPFPPPAGYDSWTDDAVYEQTTNLYMSKGATLVAEAIAAAGGDVGHLERRLLKTIRNALIDEAKATRPGLMRNRLATMLLRDPDFVRVEGDDVAVPGWALAGSPGAVRALWQGDRAELEAASWAVTVPANVVFNRSGPPPKRTRQALLAVIKAVFAAADGLYLPDQILAVVIAGRFDEFLGAEKRDVTEFATSSAPEELTATDPMNRYLAAEAADIADYLWVGFSVDERNVLPLLGVEGDDPDRARVDEVRTILGCGAAEAEAIVASIFKQIRDLAGDAETGGAVIDELMAIYGRFMGGSETGGGLS